MTQHRNKHARMHTHTYARMHTHKHRMTLSTVSDLCTSRINAVHKFLHVSPQIGPHSRCVAWSWHSCTPRPSCHTRHMYAFTPFLDACLHSRCVAWCWHSRTPRPSCVPVIQEVNSSVQSDYIAWCQHSCTPRPACHTIKDMHAVTGFLDACLQSHCVAQSQHSCVPWPPVTQ